MDSISNAVDEAFPELFGWLAGSGIAASGPPFILTDPSKEPDPAKWEVDAAYLTSEALGPVDSRHLL